MVLTCLEDVLCVDRSIWTVCFHFLRTNLRELLFYSEYCWFEVVSKTIKSNGLALKATLVVRYVPLWLLVHGSRGCRVQLHFQWLQAGPLSQSVSWEQALYLKVWRHLKFQPLLKLFSLFSQTSSSLFSMRPACIQLIWCKYILITAQSTLIRNLCLIIFGHCCVCVVREQLVKKPSFIFPQKSGGF